MTQMVYFFIYKNLVLVLVYVIHYLASGTSESYNSLSFALYNVVFTSAFSLSIGLFFIGYQQEEILENPGLYDEKKNSLVSRGFQFTIWTISSLSQAILLEKV